MENAKILCGASSYEEKFYLNPKYDILPQAVKDELKILCVKFVCDVGGIIMLEFDDNGNLRIVVTSKSGDAAFDDIGSALEVTGLRGEKRELFEQLEEYYRASCD